MLIGGVDPIWAAQYQLVIYFMIFSSCMLSTTVATAIASKQLTGEGITLVDLPDETD
jgi:ABC-type iron transport system FetAB permease component